ncbi:MAG: P-loop NTPase [Candidatus Aenigmarchaeota archaeon]|nr:P-loop NTPase [Candidatus Aenigmarchaeota archaeon]
MTRTIGVISGKGGVGKTTVVANLGAALAHRFKKDVTIVDCNLTASHLGLSLGMHYHPVTLNHVLRREKHIDESIYDHPSGMKIIPASLHLKDLIKTDISKLGHHLKKLKGKTEIIFLDSSPGLGKEAVATIKASEELIFVTRPDIMSVSDVIRGKEFVGKIKKEPIGIVLNMVTRGGHELTQKEVEIMTDLPVIAVVPHDKNVPKSLAKKIPVILHKPRTPASKELRKLAGFIIGEEELGFWDRIVRFLKT